MSCLTPTANSVLERAVQKAAQIHEDYASKSSPHHRFFHLADFDASYPDLCVKYNENPVIQCENSMLDSEHLYALACEDGDSAPHIPRPVHFFYNEGHWGYIIMEHIQQSSHSGEELVKKTAVAVKWLHSKHPPQGTNFGTIGRSFACHHVFKYLGAPRMFTSVLAVEKYLNMAVPYASKFISKPSKTTIFNLSFANDEVILSQRDMHPSNFGIALDGRPVIFDAATIHAMPTTLANFTMLFSSPFCTDVAKDVLSPDEIDALLQSSNIKCLTAVRSFMYTFRSFIPKGLDDDGDAFTILLATSNNKKQRDRRTDNGGGL